MPRYSLTWAAIRRADARKARRQVAADVLLIGLLAALCALIGSGTLTRPL